MRKIFAIIFVLFAVGIILSLVSCKKAQQPTSPTTYNQFSSSDFSLPPADNTPSDIRDCDENDDIELQPPSGYSDEDCKVLGWGHLKIKMHGHGMMGKQGKWFYLGFILKKMNLTTSEIDSIKIVIQEYDTCVSESMVALRDSEAVIIKAANQKRQIILDSLKSGTYTEAQARDSLIQLNIRTRDSLLNNPARLTACNAVKACREIFFANIELILTPSQMAIWLEFKATIPDIKCN